VQRDLATIRSLGFNTITVPVEWADAEPERGRYRFDALAHVMSLAADAGLKVVVQIEAQASPDWLRKRHPDSRVVPSVRSAAQPSPLYCLDHPGVRADLASFISAAAEAAARQSSFHAIDVWNDPLIINDLGTDIALAFCYCRHTRTRFQDWLQATYRSIASLNASWRRTFRTWREPEAPRPRSAAAPAQVVDWSTFLAVKLHEDLRLKADASAPRGARPVTSHARVRGLLLDPAAGPGAPDDWWMTRAVDHYGASLYPTRHASAGQPSIALTAALDAVRSAARDKGWWAAEVQAGPGPVRGAARAVTAADLRLWGWTAVARGARAVSYYSWNQVQSRGAADGYGMAALDGSITDRARAAGELAGVIARNPALFSGLRPQASRVAILYDRRSYMRGRSPTVAYAMNPESMLGVYRSLFEQNVQTDFLHSDEVIAGFASRYDVIYVPVPVPPGELLAHALETYERAGGTIVRDARRVATVGIDPEIRVDGGGGLVEARFLESSDAVMLIALNHADAPQKVTLRFGAGVPEAIWQNMETGAEVSFIQDAKGPIYTRTFAAKDVVVLLRGKKLRQP
jgi:beta-galactosidase